MNKKILKKFQKNFQKINFKKFLKINWKKLWKNFLIKIFYKK